MNTPVRHPRIALYLGVPFTGRHPHPADTATMYLDGALISHFAEVTGIDDDERCWQILRSTRTMTFADLERLLADPKKLSSEATFKVQEVIDRAYSAPGRDITELWNATEVAVHVPQSWNRFTNFEEPLKPWLGSNERTTFCYEH